MVAGVEVEDRMTGVVEAEVLGNSMMGVGVVMGAAQSMVVVAAAQKQREINMRRFWKEDAVHVRSMRRGSDAFGGVGGWKRLCGVQVRAVNRLALRARRTS